MYDGSHNIPDTQTEAEELEEVVMGLSSTPDKRAAWRMRH